MTHLSPCSASVGLLPSTSSAGPPARYVASWLPTDVWASSGSSIGRSSSGGRGGPLSASQNAAWAA
eukprot:14873433-Alexandrium_andersonii.AAC.1